MITFLRGILGKFGFVSRLYFRLGQTFHILRYRRRLTMTANVGPPRFNPVGTPRVSVVVCVHDQLSATKACLGALASAMVETLFEVIVVDDASSKSTRKYLDGLAGITLLRNTDNEGFLLSAQRGASQARGDIVIFLNSDTQVTDGWLDELVLAFEDETVVIAGSKLLFPNGLLQEAGSIVWRDGTGANYGWRSPTPLKGEFSYWRDVDYVSGAAMAVSRKFFEKVGGFDPRFAPAYYEDTDLCFRAREAGFRVVFVSTSLVFHHGSLSYRRHRIHRKGRQLGIARRVFVDKWAGVLSDQLPVAQPPYLQAARRIVDDAGCVVVIDFFPRWLHEGGSARLYALLNALVSRGESVVFVSLNRFSQGFYLDQLSRMGIWVVQGTSRSDMRSLGQVLPNARLVIAARPEGMEFYEQRIKPDLPDIPVFFDTVDLHFLRLRRAERFGIKPPKANQSPEEIEIAEVRFASRATKTLLTSDYEVGVLASQVPSDKLAILSLALNVVKRPPKNWRERSGFVFVSNFNHQPNADGLYWFLTEVLPQVRKELPEAPFDIVGSPLPEWVEDLTDSACRVRGWVEDLTEVYQQVRVAVAPLRFGAGVKGKVAEAWSYGIPVVGTSVALEGMHATPRSAMIDDSPEGFARCLIDLHENPELWRDYSQGGLEVVTDHFSSKAFNARLEEILAPYVPVRSKRH